MADHDASHAMPQHRNRTARGRKEQKLRAEARIIQRFLKGAALLNSHRGSQTTRIGQALATVLAQEVTHQQSDPLPLCRHFLRGRCTWGEQCKFSHVVPSHTQQQQQQQPATASWNAEAPTFVPAYVASHLPTPFDASDPQQTVVSTTASMPQTALQVPMGSSIGLPQIAPAHVPLVSSTASLPQTASPQVPLVSSTALPPPHRIFHQSDPGEPGGQLLQQQQQQQEPNGDDPQRIFHQSDLGEPRGHLPQQTEPRERASSVPCQTRMRYTQPDSAAPRAKSAPCAHRWHGFDRTPTPPTTPALSRPATPRNLPSSVDLQVASPSLPASSSTAPLPALDLDLSPADIRLEVNLMLAAMNDEELGQNSKKLTATAIRRQLEQRLQLPMAALDPRKKLVTAAARLFLAERQLARLDMQRNALVLPQDQEFDDLLRDQQDKFRANMLQYEQVLCCETD